MTMTEICDDFTKLSDRSAPKRLLIVEDELLVAEDLKRRLERRGYEIQGVHPRAEEAIEALSDVGPDLILMDIRLGGEMDGVEAAGIIREQYKLPVVFLTSHADGDTLVRAGKAHPFGYLVKPFQEDELHATICMALFRHEAETRLRKMDTWLTSTLESIGEAVIATDQEGRVLYLNPVAENITGSRLEDVVGVPVSEMLVLQSQSGKGEPGDPVQRVLATETVVPLEGDLVLFGRRDTHTPIRGTAAPTRDRTGRVTGTVVVLHDCTSEENERKERERLNAKLVETQKLESLGVLAGGVAHDFNNLLTSMLGNVDMVRSELPPDSDHVDMLLEVDQAARRAAELCKQMLSYSGHGRFILDRVNLSEFIRQKESLLAVSMGKSVVLKFDLADDLPAILADVSQLDQVLLNLVTNAAEAIGDQPGEITVKTGVVRADREYFAAITGSPNLAPGSYVNLVISDTGEGMDDDLLPNIFDPFYSTKFTGRGLGLSAVQGIVRGHSGAIGVSSAPGKGAEFSVLLPTFAAADAPEDDGPNVDVGAPEAPSGGVVLIVDDEEVVRSTAERIVSRMGFEVVTAHDGQLGAAAFREHADRLKLVLLDLTMPRMNGEESFRQMREVSSNVPVLLMSGYNQQTAIARFTDLGLAGFIQKPFSAKTLTDRIREICADESNAVESAET